MIIYTEAILHFTNWSITIRNSNLACNCLIALTDLTLAIKRYHLIGMLGWQDILHRYRRSSFGPFWLTISMGVMIGTIGVVFSRLFKSSISEFLPFLSLGMIAWGFIVTVVNEGCNSFISSENIIKQLPIPLFVHVLRVIWRNVIIFAHNIVIYPLVLIVIGKPLGWTALLSVLGFLLIVINLTWGILILGVVCTRYRDLSQMVTSMLQVLFYLTPVIWMPHFLPKEAGLYLLDFNPVYHLLEVFRAPMLGVMPTMHNWLVSVVMAVVGWIVAILVYGNFKRRIVFWL